MRPLYRLFLFLFFGGTVFAQSTFPVNGAPHDPATVFALVNANIYVDYQTFIPNGCLVVSQGKVIYSGKERTIPAGAVVIDLNGKFVYPSFIELYSEYGMPPLRFERKMSRYPQMESNVKGAYGWNQAIRPEIDAVKHYSHNPDAADEMKRSGFGIVLTSCKDGIVRGSGTIVHLADRRDNENVIAERAAAFYSFSKGSSTQDYPSSLTGAIALLRQTFYDAQWYNSCKEKRETNLSLEAFNSLQSLPAIFEAGDKFNTMRVSALAREFSKNFITKGSGNEYQRLEDIRNTGLRMMIPINFPLAFDVEDPFIADAVAIEDYKHWEQAPANPAVLEAAGIDFCITSADLKDRSSFLKNLLKAVDYGLSEKMALKALTYNPAKYLNLENQIGSLKKGCCADFFISNSNIFTGGRILQHWVNGTVSAYSDLEAFDIRGHYRLDIGSKRMSISLTGDPLQPSGKISIDSISKKLTYSFSRGTFGFAVAVDSISFIRVVMTAEPDHKHFSGLGTLPDGSWQSARLTFVSADTSKVQERKSEHQNIEGVTWYPFTAYGEPQTAKPPFMQGQGTILIRNATIWTNEKDSILQGQDLLIENGVISKIGKNLPMPAGQPLVIDATGCHVTPGIIDEHSHIALFGGVNEGAQASSAEVRMGDVIHPEDVNIYRQLAGGVTTAQLLHGSANPIGGQSALIKLRWGKNAEGLKYQGAVPFIKFALGENVKQSNWGDQAVVRFPQSRMGVEQVFADYFIRAAMWRSAVTNTACARRDLELEALAEILDNKRMITCHSYVQSEVNMLMRLSDSLRFHVNTFTHILEGYKVADKMKAHGIYASTFSDWWAYKNEVMDAIPYNATLLTRMGVVTAINSDDAEMARRLNQEAAKSIKYGGLTEVQALKLVTLNPAIMLHIDDKVGSIRTGKSADIVIWSGHPLSVYSIVKRTIIDGVVYYDLDKEQRLQQQIVAEKARIIAKMLKARKAGEPVEKAPLKKPKLYHCNTLENVSEEVTGYR